LFSDLSCRLGIDFPARQRGEFFADIHHGVTAFALAVINPKTQAIRASFVPDFRDEAVSFVHRCAEFVETIIGQFCPDVNLFGQKSPALAISSPLTQPSHIGYFRNTEFRILYLALA
jgi:hypothetical protein